MNIYGSSSFSYVSGCLSLCKEQILPTLSNQQKKIVVIASLAFACLALCYALMRCFSNPKKLNLADGSIYEGETEWGKAHGEGKRTFPDGKIYEGDFITVN